MTTGDFCSFLTIYRLQCRLLWMFFASSESSLERLQKAQGPCWTGYWKPLSPNCFQSWLFLELSNKTADFFNFTKLPFTIWPWNSCVNQSQARIFLIITSNGEYVFEGVIRSLIFRAHLRWKSSPCPSSFVKLRHMINGLRHLSKFVCRESF